MKQSRWQSGVLTTVAMLTSCTIWAQAIAPSSGLISRSGIAYSSKSGKVYVVDSEHSAIVVLSAGGTAKTVKTGSEPVSIAVDERTGKVYVANSGDKSVTVLDGVTDDIVATVPTAARPYAIAVDERSGKVYVSNTFSNMLTIINGKTNTATNLKTGSADAILVDAPHRKVYLLSYEGDSLTLLDESTNMTVRIPAGAMHLWGIAELGKTLYVTHVQDATVAAIGTEKQGVQEIPIGLMPCALAVDVEHGAVYVANYGDGSISAVNARSGKTMWTVSVGGHSTLR